MRYIKLYVFIIAVIFLFVATESKGNDRVLSDDMGTKFSPQKYSRIVSLAPSITDILIFLGVSNRIVGVTRYCNLAVEKVGGIYDPDIEKIVSLKPDIVFMLKLGNRIYYDELVKRNIQVFVLDFLTVDSLISKISHIAKLLMLEKNTYTSITTFSNHVENLFKQSEKYLKGKKFFVMYSYPDIYTASSNSFVADVIRKTGGINTTDSFPYQYQTIMINVERLVKINPDIILISCPNFTLITNELHKYGLKSKFIFVDPMDLSPSLRITNLINSIIEQCR